MPHGLCMFGADGRLAVMNNRFAEMMKLRESLVDNTPTSARDRRSLRHDRRDLARRAAG